VVEATANGGGGGKAGHEHGTGGEQTGD